MALSVAIQMDPIHSIDIRADSTFVLALEAQARGHTLHYYTPDRLRFRDGTVSAPVQRLTVRAEPGNHADLGAARLAEVAGIARLPGAGGDLFGADSETVETRRRLIAPRSPNQALYLKTIRERDVVFGEGPAGTGKTYLAVAAAVSMQTAGEVERIVLSRPAVEAGERLGFLPGDLREKVDPYLRPLYDALHDMVSGDRVMRQIGNGEIEIAPLAFMRGRTLARSFVILDEAQNTTPTQMKMFLTRLGEGSRMVVTGDMSQVDLPGGVRSGLAEALDVLAGVDGVGVVRFNSRDVVRHPVVTRIVDAYDAAARARRDG